MHAYDRDRGGTAPPSDGRGGENSCGSVIIVASDCHSNTRQPKGHKCFRSINPQPHGRRDSRASVPAFTQDAPVAERILPDVPKTRDANRGLSIFDRTAVSQTSDVTVHVSGDPDDGESIPLHSLSREQFALLSGGWRDDSTGRRIQRRGQFTEGLR